VRTGVHEFADGLARGAGLRVQSGAPPLVSFGTIAVTDPWAELVTVRVVFVCDADVLASPAKFTVTT
jgi:hypothetical protein